MNAFITRHNECMYIECVILQPLYDQNRIYTICAHFLTYIHTHTHTHEANGGYTHRMYEYSMKTNDIISKIMDVCQPLKLVVFQQIAMCNNLQLCFLSLTHSLCTYFSYTAHPFTHSLGFVYTFTHVHYILHAILFNKYIYISNTRKILLSKIVHTSYIVTLLMEHLWLLSFLSPYTR